MNDTQISNQNGNLGTILGTTKTQEPGAIIEYASPKIPYFILNTEDWIRDTRSLSINAKGIWLDIIVSLWESPTRGVMALTVDGWIRQTRSSPEIFHKAFFELCQNETCENIKLEDGRILIACRRQIREEINREKEGDRKRKQRKKPPLGYQSILRILRRYPEFRPIVVKLFPKIIHEMVKGGIL